MLFAAAMDARLVLLLGVCVFGAGGDVIVFSAEGNPFIQDEFVDEPAAFGDGLPLEGLKGFLVVGTPADGCSQLAKPPDSDNFTGKWIVLLARYNCSFEEKVRNAQAAGYDAAIVYNNNTDMEHMSAKNAVGIKIPSVFVNNETGYVLKNNYTYKNGYYIVMNREVPFDINTHLLLPFAVVVGLCLVTMIIFMIVKCIKDRRRAQRHRLPNNALKKIPTCRYSKGDPYDTCAICLDDYLEGDKLRVLPCAHAYHCKCIDPWLTKNRRVCPVCKRRVFAAGERRRRARPPESDTDTDDSSSPLVTHQRITQGGTFTQQRENPFAAAERFMERLRRGRVTATGRPADEAPPADAGVQTEADQHTSAEAAGGPSGARGGVVPFLSGILNLRHDHFARDEEDTEPLLAASQSSLPAQSDAFVRRERSRRTRRRSASSTPRPHVGAEPRLVASAHHSINAHERGEIGVAALPNTQPGPDRFIV